MSNSIIKLIESKRTVFDYKDFSLYFSNLNEQYLKKKIKNLTEEGFLTKLKKGLYYITSRGFDDFEIVNKLYSPSYISFHSALYHHGVIFQLPTSISFAYKRNIKKDLGSVKIYSKRLKEDVLYNTDGIISNGFYGVANKERAILDTLYIYSDIYFDNLNKVNKSEIKKLSKIYGNKKFEKKVDLFLNSI